MVTFRDLDASGAWRIVQSAGLSAFLVLLPFAGVIACDTLAFRRIFTRTGQAVPFAGLLRVRLASEAVLMTLPGGGILSEGLVPALLRRSCGVGLHEAVAAMAARKLLIAFSLGVYLVLAGILAVFVFPGVLRALPFAAAMAGAGLAAALLAHALLRLAGRGSVAARLFAALARLPVAALRRALQRASASLTRMDARLLRTMAEARQVWRFTPLYLASFAFEALDAYLIFRVVGAGVPFLQALPAEAAVGLARAVFVFVPAGIGVQEAGYVAFLRLLDAPDALATGAAFSLVKRGKELFWVAIGYALLAWSPPTATTVPSA